MLKKYKNPEVLLLDQGRQSLPFLKSLKQKGFTVSVVCNSRLSEAWFSRYPDNRLIWPSYLKDNLLFEKKLLEYLETYQPLVTISVGDISADILSRNYEDVIKYTNIATPSYEIFRIATDKFKTMSFCMENNIPCPRTFKLNKDNIDGIVKQLQFPVIVKPRTGIGAIGVQKLQNESELRKSVDGLRKSFGNLLVQEYISQNKSMQYQAEAFLDHNSNMKVCMVIEKPRYFPVTGGTSTANVTVKRDDIENSVKKLLEGIRWTGAADVDLIWDSQEKVAKVIEINPRVTAGIKIGFAAGIDYADLHVKLALGYDIPEIKYYKLGIYSRNLIMDTLWWIYATSEMRKNTRPSFYRFCGRNVIEQTFSKDDPLTMLGFLLHMLKKFLKPGAWKNKIGKSKAVS